MFTGIIEEMGTVKHVMPGAVSAVLSIQADKVLQGTQIGDSIAVNGVCLTVTSMQGGCFTADVMAETLRRSSLGSLHGGSRVNLERAMAADGRFGGHMVAGHIDDTGTILSMEREDNAVWVRIGAPNHVMRYIIEKGSVAIDGISLTVAKVREHDFSVSVIPHTGAETTLLLRHPGDLVNLENDLVGKYVEKLLGLSAPETGHAGGSGGLTMDKLREYGF